MAMTREDALETLVWNPFGLKEYNHTSMEQREAIFTAMDDKTLIELAHKSCQNAREAHASHGSMDYNDPHWAWLDEYFNKTK